MKGRITRGAGFTRDGEISEREIGNAMKRLLARRSSREDLHKQHVEHLPMV